MLSDALVAFTLSTILIISGKTSKRRIQSVISRKVSEGNRPNNWIK